MEEEVWYYKHLYTAGLISEEDFSFILEAYLQNSLDKSTPRSFRERIGEINLENMDDEDVLLNFRFTREHVTELIDACKSHPISWLVGTPDFAVHDEEDGRVIHRVPGMTALCITLRRLAYPNRLTDLCPMFGYSRATLSAIARAMTTDVCRRMGHLLDDLSQLQWLTTDRLAFYAPGIFLASESAKQRKPCVHFRDAKNAVASHGAPLLNCWAFVDGTARQICWPSVNQELYFSGHKRFHCVKYQSILTPDGIVVNLKGPYHGRRHDAGIWRNSGMTDQLRRQCRMPNSEDFCVLSGDPAYPLSNLLIKPYPSQTRIQHQALFNRSMSSCRVGIRKNRSRIRLC